MSDDLLLKIVVAGNESSDKTRVIQAYIPSYSHSYYKPNILHYLKVDETDVKLQIWETSLWTGDTVLSLSRALNATFFRHATGVLIVFDVDNEMTFNCIEKMCSIALELKINLHSLPVFVLVGANCDCKENKREISRERAQIVADEYGMRYIEVSSSTRHNINVLFEILIKDIIMTS